MKKMTLLFTAVILVGLFGGVGTFAWFVDTASSTGNTFNAGYVELDGDNSTEPCPLFRTSYEEDDYARYNVGLWYPGKVIAPARNYTLENTGTMPVRIAGLSAVVTTFEKNNVSYNTENMTDWPAGVQESYEAFIQNLYITVSRTLDGEYFNGTLQSLIESPQALEATDGYVILLNEGRRANLQFGASMSTSADNKTQGVTANVDIIVHGTQDNTDAINALLGNE